MLVEEEDEEEESVTIKWAQIHFANVYRPSCSNPIARATTHRLQQLYINCYG